MQKRPLKVLFLPVDDGGCGWFRIRQWHELFQLRDDVESILMTGKEENQLDLVKNADVVVGRLGDTGYIKEIKTNIDPSKPLIFDHDDNTMEVLPTSEHYREFGTKDAWVKKKNEIKPVWVTGYTKDFNRYKNLWGQMGLLFCLGSADMITTPTSYLTQFYVKYGGDNCIGSVVPNSLNFDMYPEGDFKPKDKKKGEIRLGWQGGVSHLGDWNEVKEPLTKVMKNHPEVTLHVLGSYYKNQFKEFEDRVKFYPWVPWKGYTYRLKTMALDGAIIPLESKPFNEYKSEVKFTEFSQLGIPCMVKDMLPYNVVCKGGNNCWTYKNNEEFEKRLEDMINDLKGDRKKSKKYIKNAKKWIKEERDATVNAGKLVQLYKQVLPDEVKEQLI